jgi:hypothetical protein
VFREFVVLCQASRSFRARTDRRGRDAHQSCQQQGS